MKVSSFLMYIVSIQSVYITVQVVNMLLPLNKGTRGSVS
jgi:hypothetical protein